MSCPHGRDPQNFEKFLLASDGSVVGRFRPTTEPDSAEIRTAIEAALRS